MECFLGTCAEHRQCTHRVEQCSVASEWWWGGLQQAAPWLGLHQARMGSVGGHQWATMQATGHSCRIQLTLVGTPAATSTCAAVDNPVQAPARSRVQMASMVAVGNLFCGVIGVFGTRCGRGD